MKRKQLIELAKTLINNYDFVLEKKERWTIGEANAQLLSNARNELEKIVSKQQAESAVAAALRQIRPRN